MPWSAPSGMASNGYAADSSLWATPCTSAPPDGSAADVELAALPTTTSAKMRAANTYHGTVRVRALADIFTSPFLVGDNTFGMRSEYNRFVCRLLRIPNSLWRCGWRWRGAGVLHGLALGLYRARPPRDYNLYYKASDILTWRADDTFHIDGAVGRHVSGGHGLLSDHYAVTIQQEYGAGNCCACGGLVLQRYRVIHAPIA